MTTDHEPSTASGPELPASRWPPVRPVFVALAALGSLLILGPIAKLLLVAPANGFASVFRDRELLAAIGLTVASATGASLLVAGFGIPLGYLLARTDFPGKRLAAAALQLPIIIPHPVAGIALLLFLGRNTTLGSLLAGMGLEVVNHVPGLVVAMAFVSAPIFVAAARQAFAAVDPTLERVARTLGDDEWGAFRRVALPLAARGLLSGVVVTWARAVSEFGAVVVVTYYPKTAGVLIYDRFTTDGLRGVIPGAALLLLVALAIIAGLSRLEPKGPE
jgi:molybdate/tungstate transport system permease protein